MTLISFWATWCGSCIDEFADLQETFQMYKVRDFDLITVSANMPDEKGGVMRMLEKNTPPAATFCLLRMTPRRCRLRSTRPGIPLSPIPSSSLRRQDSVQKSGYRGHSRIAPNNPCQSAIGLHRLQSILAGRLHSKGLREKVAVNRIGFHALYAPGAMPGELLLEVLPFQSRF